MTDCALRAESGLRGVLGSAGARLCSWGAGFSLAPLHQLPQGSSTGYYSPRTAMQKGVGVKGTHTPCDKRIVLILEWEAESLQVGVGVDVWMYGLLYRTPAAPPRRTGWTPGRATAT